MVVECEESFKDVWNEQQQIMHGSLGFMVNNHPTLRAEPKEKGGYCIDNRDSILSTVIVNPRLYYHVLCGKSSLVVISNLQYSLHCKQGSLQETS